MVLHQLVQEYCHFQGYCKERTQKVSTCTPEKAKTESFIDNKSLKKVSGGQSLVLG